MHFSFENFPPLDFTCFHIKSEFDSRGTEGTCISRFTKAMQLNMASNVICEENVDAFHAQFKRSSKQKTQSQESSSSISTVPLSPILCTLDDLVSKSMFEFLLLLLYFFLLNCFQKSLYWSKQPLISLKKSLLKKVRFSLLHFHI